VYFLSSKEGVEDRNFQKDRIHKTIKYIFNRQMHVIPVQYSIIGFCDETLLSLIHHSIISVRFARGMQAGGVPWDVWFSVPPRELWWSTLRDEWPDLLAVFVLSGACFLWALRPYGSDRERVVDRIRRTTQCPQRLALNAQLSSAPPTASVKTQPSRRRHRGSDGEEEQPALSEAVRACAKHDETCGSLLDGPRYLGQLNAGCSQRMSATVSTIQTSSRSTKSITGKTDTAARSSGTSANMQQGQSHSAANLQATQVRIQKACIARRALEAPPGLVPFEEHGHAEHEGHRPTMKALMRSNERERVCVLRRGVSEESLQSMSPSHDSSNTRQRRLPRSHSDEAIIDNKQRSCGLSSLGPLSLSSSSSSSPARPGTRQNVAAAGSDMRRQGTEVDAVTAQIHHLSAELGRLKQKPESVQTLQQQVAVLTRLLQQHDTESETLRKSRLATLAQLESAKATPGVSSVISALSHQFSAKQLKARSQSFVDLQALPRHVTQEVVALGPAAASPLIRPGCGPSWYTSEVARSPISGDLPSTSSCLAPGSPAFASKVQRSPSSGSLFYSHVVHANFLAGVANVFLMRCKCVANVVLMWC